MSLIEQCDTLISLIRHGVEAWRDGDGDAVTAHATLSNIEQLDKRVHQLSGTIVLSDDERKALAWATRKSAHLLRSEGWPDMKRNAEILDGVLPRLEGEQ